MRADLVHDHEQLARSLSRRYLHRGEPSDDLEQVALLALVKAARRFDPGRNVPFATYATASVLGEIKRHFRDRAWALRVPRSTQELYLRVQQAREELGQRMRASPTVEQVANHLGVDVEAVLDAMEAGGSYWSGSLDAFDGDGPTGRWVAMIDPSFERTLDRERILAVLSRLANRERHVVTRLFFDGWTQERVAAEIGISQMQVSRVLARSVTKLRGLLGEG